MEKRIVAANWKMNTTLPEGIALAKELNETLKNKTLKCRVILSVPFTHITSVVAVVDADQIAVAAENIADQPAGAYTGEVSAAMVQSAGATYAIIGHSERRAYYHETSEILKRKINLALQHNLQPIYCVGETLVEREAGREASVVEQQLKDVLFDLPIEQLTRIVIAYEPVWAIGTGKTATTEQVDQMHACIRNILAAQYGRPAIAPISVLYGGSCNADNAKELFALPNVDGGLIGGASLSVAKFLPVIEAF